MLVHAALNIIAAIFYFTAMGIAIDVGIRADDLKAALDIIEMGQRGWKAASAAGTILGAGFLSTTCCYCASKSRGCAAIQAGFTTIFTVVAIVGAAMSSHLKNETNQNVHDKLQPSFKAYVGELKSTVLSHHSSINSNSDLMKNWQSMQTSFSCCGISGPGDYFAHNVSTPMACYAGTDRGTPGAKPFSTGCQSAVYTFHISKAELMEVFDSICSVFNGLITMSSGVIACSGAKGGGSGYQKV